MTSELPSQKQLAATWEKESEEEKKEEEDLLLCVLTVLFSSLSFLPPCRVGRVLCVLTVFSVLLLVFLFLSLSRSSIIISSS